MISFIPLDQRVAGRSSRVAEITSGPIGGVVHQMSALAESSDILEADVTIALSEFYSSDCI
jgi:hypothetical protein